MKLPRDYLLLGIGVPYSRRSPRRTVTEQLALRGAMFVSFEHLCAVVADSAGIGRGSNIFPHAVVSNSARLKSYVLVNYHASLGHDSSAGDFAVMSPYATLGGGASIGEAAFLGLHASVGHGRAIGARSKVSASSCTLSEAPPDSIAYRVPGRIVPRAEPGLSCRGLHEGFYAAVP